MSKEPHAGAAGNRQHGGHCAPLESALGLNAACCCITLDRQRLDHALKHALPPDVPSLAESHPQLFSPTPFFVAQRDLQRMAESVLAIEAAVRLPPFQTAVMAQAAPIARFNPGPLGVFMGYDFHLGANGPQLIEINTNAGGALINAYLARAQHACCDFMRPDQENLPFLEARVVAMFEREWLQQRGTGRPRTIAIVDDAPETQFLYPEFLLAQALLRRHGIDAFIIDAAALSYHEGRLHAEATPIDLVYNRLVDFALNLPEHRPLREAYAAGDVVLTPHPHAHALFANKRNLAHLADPERLRDWGLPEDQAQILAQVIPPTFVVRPEDEDWLWAQRAQLFFKPAAGHASKGVYRGSKLTRRVFAEILRGDYVAQRYTAPSDRVVMIDDVPQRLKADVRLYTYAGEVLLTAARLYRGQATNLRTRGGGFAPVFGWDEARLPV